MSTCNRILKSRHIIELVSAVIPGTLLGFNVSFDMDQNGRGNYRKDTKRFLRRRE